jgi:hypothetical protein
MRVPRPLVNYTQMSPFPPRTVALVGAVCVTIGWLLASTLSPPVANLQSLPARQAAVTPPAEEIAFTEQLQLRMRQAPAAPTPRRNPFAFGQRAPQEQAVRSWEAASVSEPAAPVLPPAPVGPALLLAGIGISGDVRTAILTDGQAVHVVKVGDRVGGYEVVEVTDDSATLAGGELRYRLRLR